MRLAGNDDLNRSFPMIDDAVEAVRVQLPLAARRVPFQQTDLGLRGKISSGGGVPRALSAGKGVVVGMSADGTTPVDVSVSREELLERTRFEQPMSR